MGVTRNFRNCSGIWRKMLRTTWKSSLLRRKYGRDAFHGVPNFAFFFKTGGKGV